MKSAGKVAGQVLAGLVTAGLLATACGSESAVLDETVPTSDPSSTTEPPAEDEAVFARIEALARDTTAVIDELRQDPEALEESGNEDTEKLSQYHTSPSPRLDRILGELEDLAEDGQRYVPRVGQAFTEVVLFRPDIENPDTVTFEYCESRNVEILDSDDDVVETIAGVAFGDGEARRVDGKWLIYEMELWHEVPVPPERVQSRECLIYTRDLDSIQPRSEREEEQDDSDDEDEHGGEDDE